MATIQGTAHKMSPTDFFQRCAYCGRVFYFARNFKNGATVVCPFCGHRH